MKTLFARYAGAIALLLALASGAASAQQTALLIQSDAGDPIGHGQTAFLPPSPTNTFDALPNSANGFTVYVGPWTMNFASATNVPLAAGAYESAARFPFNGSSPGLDVNGPSGGCNTLTGRFVVHEIVVNGLGVLQSLAVDFEHHCENYAPALWGELRINSAVPLTWSKPAGSTLPGAMAFNAQTLVPPSALVTSNWSTVYSINSPAAISIVGGAYSVNFGPFVSTPGSVNNRDHVQVQQTSSPDGGITKTATLSVGGLAVPFNVTTIVPGAAITALYYKSYPGDYIGAGQTVFAHAPDWSIVFQRNPPDQVQVNLNGPGFNGWTLNLFSALGAPLAIGAYEEAARAPFRGASPGLDFSGSGRGCNTLIGRFAVLEADFSNISVPRFAANFEQWCDDAPAPLLGEVRINSTVPFNHLVTETDSLPDPMALWAQGPVKAGSTVYSNWTRVYGVNVAVPISISGPASFSINEGEFSPAPRTANNLDLIEVSMQASNTPGAAAQSTLNVGGRSIPFSVTTYQPGQLLTGLHFRSTPGDYIGQGETRTYLAPYNGLTTLQFGYGFSLSIKGLDGDSWSLIMTPPNGSVLMPGVYEGAVGIGLGSPGLSFSGNGRGCSQTGRFVVHEAAFNPDGSVQNFSADFEAHCGNGAPLYGEFRYNSTIPFSFLNATYLSAASRKSHGAAGTFDLELAPAPIDGAITIEPRAVAPGHAIVFRFDAPIFNPGTATCVDAFGAGVGTITSVTASGNEVTVNLTGIGDQRVTVALANVNASGISASASLGFLVGDVSLTKTVTAADILRIKGRQGPVDSSNFKFDLDLSGGVSPGDLLAAKERSGLSLP